MIWQVVVIGAGPAGSLVAHQLAGRGLSVLLIDRAHFPRWKVCGCCINGRALSALALAGLGDLPAQCGAIPLHAMRCSARGQEVVLPLSSGMVLSREVFDEALIDAAKNAGAEFWPGTTALRIEPAPEAAANRTVVVRRGAHEVSIDARLLVVAAGLNCHLLHDVGGTPRVAEASYIGAGAIADGASDFFEPGVVFMACGDRGYVGMVRREDGLLTVAAALGAPWVKKLGGPGCVASQTLEATTWPDRPDLASLEWKGTPALTRSGAPLAANRIFVLGDAAGYVEPFTGEGMAWALTGALALAPIADRAARDWRPSYASQWRKAYRQMVGRRKILCGAITEVLRWPALTHAGIQMLHWIPGLARPVLAYLNQPTASPTERL